MPEATLEGFRLAAGQSRLWRLFGAGRLPASQLAVELRGPLDEAALARALAALVARHEVLRTRFGFLPGMEVPIQIVEPPPAAVACPVSRVSAVVAPEEDAALLELAAAEARPFDLESVPLVRFHRAELGPLHSLLLVTLPALVADERSLGILLRELALLYGRAAEGGAAESEPVQFLQFSEWQHELATEPEAAAAAAFFRSRGTPAPAPVLPFEGSPEGRFERRVHRLEPAAAAAVEAAAARLGVSLAAFLLAAFQALLHRLCASPEITLDVRFAGRPFEELEDALGLFAVEVPLLGRPRPALPFRLLAERADAELAAAGRYQAYYAAVAEGPAERAGISFALAEAVEPVAAAGVHFALAAAASCGTWTRLALAARLRGAAGLELTLAYDRGAVDGGRARHLLEEFATLLLAAAGEPERALGELALIGPGELAEIERAARPEKTAAAAAPPWERLERLVAEAPEAIAVVAGVDFLSTAELAARARGVAAAVGAAGHGAAGYGADAVVGILLERSVDLAVALVGTLEAGAAYLPLDPALPDARLAFMVEEAGVALVVTEPRFAGRRLSSEPGAAEPARLAIDGITPTTQVPVRRTLDQHLAYVLYTSGSTGRPKAVMVRHSALANLAAALAARIYARLGSGLRVGMNAPASFDASVKQLLQLFAGHTLVLVPEEVRRDAEALATFVAERRIEVLDVTPAQLRPLLAAGLAAGAAPALRCLLVGGEAISAALWRELAALPGITAWNVYGPTECTVDATAEEIRPGTEPALGRPLPNVSLEIADRRGLRAPIGVPGELLIGGAGLARGYLGRPGLTAARFVPGAAPGERSYRSGDLARLRADGRFEILGRTDFQVKLRGVRIELEEIEHCLLALPAVAAAAVVVRGGEGQEQLVAYLEPRQGQAQAPAGLPRLRLPNGLSAAYLDRAETEELYREIFVDRVYLRHGIDLPEAPTVLDVGANIGMFSLFVSQLRPRARIFAFEPLAPIGAVLGANLAAWAPGVHARPFGLANAEGEVELTFYPHYPARSGRTEYADPEGEIEVVKTFLRNQGERGVDVGGLLAEVEEVVADRFRGERHRCRLRRLSDVIAEEGIEHIDLLKVDVQRSELDVLLGINEADWARIDQVVMEVHDHPERPTAGRVREIQALLARHGFRAVTEQEELLRGTDRYSLYARREGLGARAAPPPPEPVAPAGFGGLDPQELRAVLRQQLPEIMIPATFVILPTLPLTRHGKIDRLALPEPPAESAVTEGAAPRSAVEEILAELWATVLGHERVAVTADFFELGGHSLIAAQLMLRVRAAFAVELPLRHLFEAPTVERLAKRVEAALAGGAAELPPLLATPRSGWLPLSAAQERLWFLDQLAGPGATYNTFHALRLQGPLDVRALATTLEAAIGRHETLRSTFPAEGGRPVLRIAATAAARLQLVDLSALEPQIRAAHAARLAERAVARPFALAVGPLLRLELFRFSGEEHQLLLTMHHIICDAWSLGVLIREVSALYGAAREGRPSPLAPLPIQYVDYAAWQRGWLAGETLARLVAHWRGRLGEGREPLALPTDRGGASGDQGGALLPFALSSAQRARAKAAGREHHATLFMVLLAAFKVLLVRLTEERTIAVGTAVAGRDRLEVEGLIGFFVNTLVLTTEVEGSRGFAAHLARVRATSLDAFTHQALPFDKLVEELAPVRAANDVPFFRVAFNFHQGEGEALELAGLRLSGVPLARTTTKLDLTLNMTEREGRLLGAFEYRTALFDRTTIARFARLFTTLFEAALAAPEQALGALPALASAEQQQALREWNDSGVKGDGAAIHQLVLAWAERQPEAIAITDGKEAWSYGHLERGSRAVAAALLELGVERESFVALGAERSPAMVLGLVAALRAGAAVVPLDPAQPAERLARLVAEVNPAVVLLTPGLDPAAFAPGRPSLTVAPPWPAGGGDLPLPRVDPATLAYVVFTSGSTGLPKGVMVPHRGFTNMIRCQRRLFRLAPGRRMHQITAFGLDAPMCEIFLCLAGGGTLVLIARDTARSPAALASYLAEQRVQAGKFPPALLAALRGTELPDLDCIGSMGEALTPDLVAAWAPGRTLWNGYGPTEVTIGSSMMSLAGSRFPRPPIGRPLDNYRVYVLDRGLRPRPLGVPGELVVGGLGVARGYLGKPRQTAERFVPDPFSGEAGARLYRTGDRARLLPDGLADFLGRIDLQIKIRGHRIEPGEVEAALCAHPAVAEAVVVAEGEGAEERSLVAYVAPRASTAEDNLGGTAPELWPSVAEHPVLDDLLYFAMTRDQARVDAYREAIRRLAPGKVVLEIGPGRDAFLSRFALEAGAARVYAIELSAESYERARQVLRASGEEARIELLCGDATAITLPEPVDLVIASLFGSIASNEGALPVLADARRRHLRAGGTIIPERAITHLAAVELPAELLAEPAFSPLAAHYARRIFDHAGKVFDLRLAVRNLPLAALISTTAPFEELDDRPAAEQREVTLEVLRPGRCDGFLLWLELRTAAGFGVDVFRQRQSLLPIFFPAFEPGVEVRAGDRLEVLCERLGGEEPGSPSYRVSGRLWSAAAAPLPFEHRSAAGPRGAPAGGSSTLHHRLFGGPDLPLRQEAELSAGGLHAFLRPRLPEVMVPAHYVVLERLPRTAAGKVDRRALPPRNAAPAPVGNPAEVARGPLEELLTGLFEEVLAGRRVGRHESFFALGGHSLLATRLLSRLRQALEIEIPLSTFFAGPTVAELAAAVKTARQAPASAPLPPPVPRAAGEEAPLSFAQERLWFLNQLEPGSTVHNLPLNLRLRGPLAAAALGRAVAAVAVRHRGLRAVFLSVEGRALVREGRARIGLPSVDLTVLAREAGELELARLAGRSDARPFDLATGPLLRAALVRLAPEDHAVLATVHHIVADGWSLDLLLADIAAAYKLALAGRPASLPPLPIQYGDFAAWQRRSLTGARREELIRHWRGALAGMPGALALPFDRPRPAAGSARGASLSLRLPAATAAALAAEARQAGVTPFMVWLAAFSTLLARSSRQADFGLGTPIAGRNHAELEPLVGLFINNLVLRQRPRAERTFRAFEQEVREVTLAAFDHQELPFEALVDALEVERDLARHPLFQVMFSFQNIPWRDAELPAVTLSPLNQRLTVSEYELELAVLGGEAGNEGILKYKTDLFDSTTIGRLLGQLANLLAGALSRPEAPLGSFELLAASERGQVLAEWNDTAWPGLPATTMWELFEATSGARPDGVAVVCEERALSYGALTHTALELASQLARHGVGPEALVALLAERSERYLAAMLGVFAAGGAYLPLDPSHPAERHRHLLAVSGPAAVLAGEEFEPRLAELCQSLPALPPLVPLVPLPTLAPGRRTAPVPRARCTIPTGLAYVMYTSGSTGQPKGAMIDHRGLVNHLFAKIFDLGMEAGDRLAQTAASTFDISVWQFLAPLVLGGVVEVFPDELAHAGPRLLRALEERRCTLFETVPSLLTRVILDPTLDDEGLPPLTALRVLVSTGEALAVETARRWFAAYPTVPVANAWGLTETSDDVAHHLLRAAPTAAELRVPAGRVVVNAQIYVVDPAGRPVGLGMPGEVWVGGVAVGRGYHRDPRRTALAFIPDPFATTPGARLYRTGDQGRWLAGGALDFLGRADHQVKIRGLRVELGEIEAALAAEPGVRQAVALVRGEGSAPPRLVAYVVIAGRPEAEAGSELRRALAARLPDAMVPTVIVPLAALPVNASGKADRKALAALPLPTEPGTEAPARPPRSRIEAELAAIWAEVLKRETVGIDESFFALGGDSILSIQVVAKAARRGLTLAPRQMFEHQTIAELALVVGEGRTTHAEQGLLTGPLPLTPAAERFFARALPRPSHFNQSLLLRVAAPLARAPFEGAVRALFAHHDALRLRFRKQGGRIEAELGGLNAVAGAEWIDLSDRGAAERTRAIEEVVAGLQASLDLEAGPIARFAYLALGEGDGRLFAVVHHLAVDGVSWRILLEDLATAYEQMVRTGAVALPPKTTSLAHWARGLVELGRTPEIAAELAFWTSAARRRAAPLPRDFAGGDDRAVNCERDAALCSVELAAAATADLLSAPERAYNARPQEVLVAALAKALARATGSRQVLLELEEHGREEELVAGADLSRTVGWFTSEYPLAIDLGAHPEPGAELVATKELMRRVPRHGIGHGLLQADREHSPTLAALPAAEVIFNYLGQAEPGGAEGGVFASAPELKGPAIDPDAPRSHLLEINASITGGSLQAVFRYGAKVHRRETIEGLAADFLAAVTELVAHCRELERGVSTPADFELADLDARQLGKVLAQVRRARGTGGA